MPATRGTDTTRRRRRPRAFASLIALALTFLLALAPIGTGVAAALLHKPDWAATGKSAPKKKKKKKKGKGKKGKGKKKATKKPKKKPAKKPAKKGSSVGLTLTANPTTAVIPPGGKGCSTLTVSAFTTAPGAGGPVHVPFHGGAATHLVHFSTTLGAIAPNPARLDPARGRAVATLCSGEAGVAEVAARVPGFEAKQLAKQCKQTNGHLCNKGKAPASATASVSFRDKYSCAGAQTTLFDSSNFEAVQSGAGAPSFSTGSRAYCLTSITTYHWNEGAGAPPGLLGLTVLSSPLQAKGAKVGPWRASASSGQNGAPNVNWYVYPPRTPPAVIEGTYSCYDSSPATWSWNEASGGVGFCTIQVIPAVAATA